MTGLPEEYEDDEELEAKHRKQFLKRTTDLSEREAKTLAWREIGFSPSGVAKRIESTKGTVKSRLDRIAAQYGLFAIHTKPPEKRGNTDLEEPTREDIEELAPEIQETWYDLVSDHPEVAPDWAVEEVERWHK